MCYHFSFFLSTLSGSTKEFSQTCSSIFLYWMDDPILCGNHLCLVQFSQSISFYQYIPNDNTYDALDAEIESRNGFIWIDKRSRWKYWSVFIKLTSGFGQDLFWCHQLKIETIKCWNYLFEVISVQTMSAILPSVFCAEHKFAQLDSKQNKE